MELTLERLAEIKAAYDAALSLPYTENKYALAGLAFDHIPELLAAYEEHARLLDLTVAANGRLQAAYEALAKEPDLREEVANLRYLNEQYQEEIAEARAKIDSLFDELATDTVEAAVRIRSLHERLAASEAALAQAKRDRDNYINDSEADISELEAVLAKAREIIWIYVDPMAVSPEHEEALAAIREEKP